MTFYWRGQSLALILLPPASPPPYALLELADPSRKMIDAYLGDSWIYLLSRGEEILAVMVIYPLDEQKAEIKNIAITKAEQGKGLGKILLAQAKQISREKGFQKLRIGT
ncbi:MAG: GNAT family N-acetyltransferase, partial [Bacteroidota bacterium]